MLEIDTVGHTSDRRSSKPYQRVPKMRLGPTIAISLLEQMRKLPKRTEEALVRWLGSSRRSADRRAEGAARSVMELTRFGGRVGA
jgi:hypothetical protein